MTSQTSLSGINNPLAQRSSSWLKIIRELANQTGCLEAVDPAFQMLKKLRRESINITIIGSRNTGKSNLINKILNKKLLPVSAISNGTGFYIQGENESEKEGFYLANDSAFQPLEKLQQGDFGIDSSETSVTINLAHQWLIDNSFHLIEKPTFDASDEDIKKLTNYYLEETDCAVLLIDALTPLRKAEVYLLSECTRRCLPTVVILTKIDKLLEDERDEVVEYVNKHLQLQSDSLKVIPVSLQSIDDNQVLCIKSTIQEELDKTDILSLRTQQLADALLNVLGLINSAAHTGLKAQTKNEEDRQKEIKKRQQNFDLQNLTWQKIELNLDSRRRKIDELLRDHLQKNHTSILEVLSYDLKRNNDIRTWWERDLPFRLDKELRSIAGKLSQTINQQIVSDLQWLQGEISQQFKYPLQASTEANVTVNMPSMEQREIPLSNSNHLKIVSRLSTVTCVIIAGTVLTPLGIGGAGIAASVFAGLTLEQLLSWNTKQEREKVFSELNKVIDQAEREYASEVSNKLKENYNHLVSQLKQNQMRWQQAQLQALMAVKRNSDQKLETNWNQVIQQTNQLIEEIKTEIGI
ncbi:MAG: 50S ribosome-binding GTPase [Xenococcus sp. MO_188.B8]|nr:50S ribosome-binding GTPase [Xenococcus sp. MO_188.B8]